MMVFRAVKAGVKGFLLAKAEEMGKAMEDNENGEWGSGIDGNLYDRRSSTLSTDEALRMAEKMQESDKTSQEND